ncbi:hypothetical protein [Sphingobium sp. MK2]|uniref:hypothetical protein n=1 Tax=Sphingobium sp. MK2 TaxID=3116540 RepID=UPI0032E3636A
MKTAIILIGITAVCLIAWMWWDISRTFTSLPYRSSASDDQAARNDEAAAVMCMVAAVCCL